jgi:hypothetical protein
MFRNLFYRIEFYPETHCNQCDEISHNHFDCPICNTEYASTNIYGYIYDKFVDFVGLVKPSFKCKECGTVFSLIEFNYDKGFVFIKEK